MAWNASLQEILPSIDWGNSLGTFRLPDYAATRRGLWMACFSSPQNRLDAAETGGLAGAGYRSLGIAHYFPDRCDKRVRRDFARDFTSTSTKMPIVNRSTFLRIVVAIFTVATFAWAQPVKAADPVVVLKKNLGTIEIQLDTQDAPITTANFLAYVDKKFYDGTVFHRVVRGFVAEGGGYTADGQEKQTDAPIKNEATNGLHNIRGTISMARTNDPNSATSQFFLNFVDNSAGKLDPGGFSA